MTSSRRVPTGLLVLFAVVVVGAGALWWTRAAPATARPASPAAGDEVRIMQLQNGAVLGDGGVRTAAFSGSSQQQASLNKLISTQWPCRIDRPGSRRFDLLRDDLNVATLAQLRVIRLPTCGATATPRR